MSTAELSYPDTVSAASMVPEQAGNSAKNPYNHLISGCFLAFTDIGLLLAALVPWGWALTLAVPLLALYAAAGLYPGFGLMSAERLRRRWLLGAPLAGLATLINSAVALAILLYLIVAPLAEAAMRHILHKRGYWGKPVRVTGRAATILAQNWQLGLIPAENAPTLVVMPGCKPPPGSAKADKVFLLQDGGFIRPIRPQPRALARWLGQVRTANPAVWPYSTIKRLIDVILGLVLLIATSPLVLLAMLAIYAADPGPVIYSQFRRCQHGNRVRIYKLRSMYQNSEQRLQHILETDAQAAASWSRCFKLQPDPRVLPLIGGFIRRFSIDELPQLINILKGEMSLVGPRVFVDYDLAIYPPHLLNVRHSVPAGLTGLWQVSVRSDGDNADKVRYDTAYVQGWSLWLDIDILYRTVGAVLTGRGAA